MPGVEGQVALVTGAGRGIGRVTAELMASRGARVMAVSRSENELQSLGLDYVVADLGKPEDCARAVKETQDRLGPVTILVVKDMIKKAYGRMVTPKEVAEVIAFLASEEASGVNGEAITVALGSLS